MFKAKKVIALFMIMAAALGAIPAYAAGYVTIDDLREETKDGWHETYTYKGEEIRVDVDIEIPNVEKVPIVQITYPANVHPLSLPPNADVLLGRGGFSYSVESAPNTIFGLSGGINERTIAKGAQAENSPFAPNDAMVFATELLTTYFDTEKYQFELAYMDAYSRMYKSDNGVPVYDKPVTEMGYYTLCFRQLFHGIPYVRQNAPFVNPPRSNTIPAMPMGECSFVISSENNYGLSFYPAAEELLIEDDVPLIPFSEIKATLEKLIHAGYIKNVYKVRLEYLRMNNPNDIENSAILIPVWELNGDIVQNPKNPGPLPTFTEEKIQWLREVGGAQEVLVNAQTGEYFDPMDNRENRNVASFLAWDEVK